jgi:exo-beta-1,3-glucanase (GH17 family)
VDNEERYFREVAEWSNETSTPVFWMEAFSEPWKDPGYAGVERHWGLWTADGVAKFPLADE